MTDPDDQNSAPGGESPGPGSPPPAEESPDDGLYAVSEPEPEPPGVGGGVTMPEWYLVAGGAKEGPLGLLEMQQRVSSGGLRRETLVWKSGMTDWTTAGSVPELFEASAESSPPPLPSSAASPSSGTAAGTSSDTMAKASEMLQVLDGVFASPVVYRTTGRTCAALGVLTLLVATILLVAKYDTWFSWFCGFLLFALIFLIGEAAGAILQALGRIQSQSAARPEPEENPQQHGD